MALKRIGSIDHSGGRLAYFVDYCKCDCGKINKVSWTKSEAEIKFPQMHSQWGYMVRQTPVKRGASTLKKLWYVLTHLYTIQEVANNMDYDSIIRRQTLDRLGEIQEIYDSQQ